MVADVNSIIQQAKSKYQLPQTNMLQPAQVPATWRFDPEYEAGVNAINQNLAQLGSSANLAEQRFREDYTQGAQQLTENRDVTLKRLQEKLANQGIGRSGINVEAQGDILKEYLGNVGNLEKEKTRTLEDTLREIIGKQQDYQQQFSDLGLSRAKRQEAFELKQAEAEAQAKTNADIANDFRSQVESLKADLLKQLTPQPTPTGQLSLPPPVPAPKSIATSQSGSGAGGGGVPAPTAPYKADTGNILALQNPISGIMPGLRPGGNWDVMFDTPDKVRQVQEFLKKIGYDPGPMDGKLGPRTKHSIDMYAWANSQNKQQGVY